MTSQRNLSWVLAALIVGAAVVAGSYMVARSLRGISERMEAIEVAISDFREAAVGGGDDRPSEQARRQGLDPSERYALNTESAPARGPEDAPIQIVELADFQ